MTDRFSKVKRSYIMARIKGSGTGPEKIVHSILRKLKQGFTKNERKVFGNPDIVFKNQRKAIFVNGCFWHGHCGCQRAVRPTTNKRFWNLKIDKNIKRDRIVRRILNQKRYSVLTVWQCQTKQHEKLEARLQNFIKKRQLAK